MDLFDRMTLDQQHAFLAAVVLIAQGIGWWLTDMHTRKAVTKALNGHNHDSEAHNENR